MWIVILGTVAAMDLEERLSGPQQIHLAYGDTDRSMTVMWTTFAPTNSTSVSLCVATNNCQTIAGRMSLFLFQDEDNSDYTPIPRYIHTVNLTDLIPDHMYSYRVGSEEVWSQVFRFRGSKVSYSPGRIVNSTRFIDFGDFGTCSNLSLPTLIALTKESLALDQDFFILDGDIAYDLYMYNGIRGDEFMRNSERFAAFTPFMVVAGNHEHFYNYSHFKTLFNMPQDTENFYYSYNVGPAHFVVFNTDFLCSSKYCKEMQKKQVKWLETDLKAANQRRDAQPWIFVFSHRPLYCSVDWEDLYNYDDCARDSHILRSTYEDIVAAYKVDIYFEAHVHNYERFEPIYQNARMPSTASGPHMYVNPSAPVFVLSGSAGSCDIIDWMNRGSSTPEEFSVFRTEELSYTRVEADLSTVKVQQVSSLTGAILDYFFVVKY